MTYKYLIVRYGNEPEAVYDTKDEAKEDIERKYNPDKWKYVRVRDRTRDKTEK